MDHDDLQIDLEAELGRWEDDGGALADGPQGVRRPLPKRVPADPAVPPSGKARPTGLEPPTVVS